jgi:hypothetical protein
MSFNLVASSLSVECNFEQPAATPFRIVAASLSVMPTPVQAMASMSVECNFDVCPPVSLKIAGASLSLITQYTPATVASLSLVPLQCSAQVVDLRKGTSILKKY